MGAFAGNSGGSAHTMTGNANHRGNCARTEYLETEFNDLFGNSYPDTFRGAMPALWPLRIVENVETAEGLRDN
jgi:hypothetical protein